MFALRREIEELRKALADQTGKQGKQGKRSVKPLSEEVGFNYIVEEYFRTLFTLPVKVMKEIL